MNSRSPRLTLKLQSFLLTASSETHCSPPSILPNDLCSKMARVCQQEKRTSCICVATQTVACPQKPAIAGRSGNRGIQRMHRLLNGGVRKRLLWPVGALLAFFVLWLGFGGSQPQLAQDFEECVEQVQASPPSNDGVGALMTECNVRFAGRRKADGGYTYYDFMQDRIFDIAGPNPTAEERKQIDREYINYLDAQRREAVSAELAKRQNEQLRADLERARQPVGPPMVLTPTSLPPTAGKRLFDRSKATRCGDDSLSCNWAKFSTAVKNAFASPSSTKP